MAKRTSPKAIAQKIARYFHEEHPDYNYLRKVFVQLRKELGVSVNATPRKFSFVPNEDDIKRYYETVQQAENIQDAIIIKLILYTGIRVSELIRIRSNDVDLHTFTIKIAAIKGKKERLVPFPKSFRETLALQMEKSRQNMQVTLFYSLRKRPYTDRGVRRILEKHSESAGFKKNISPQALRHFLLAWLKKHGVEDEAIQLYSGHEKQQSLEIYKKMALESAQHTYDNKIRHYPV